MNIAASVTTCALCNCQSTCTNTSHCSFVPNYVGYQIPTPECHRCSFKSFNDILTKLIMFILIVFLYRHQRTKVAFTISVDREFYVFNEKMPKRNKYSFRSDQSFSQSSDSVHDNGGGSVHHNISPQYRNKEMYVCTQA